MISKYDHIEHDNELVDDMITTRLNNKMSYITHFGHKVYMIPCDTARQRHTKEKIRDEL